jgi:hypothetical protein
MALAIPGAHGLCCSLQEALRHKYDDGALVRPGTHVHAFVKDCGWLADELMAWPTRLLEVVSSAKPATRGACNASGKRMGASI